MDFVATTDFKTPYVVSTGMPHKPTKIMTKNFKKGDIICGELKESKGKPAFVLYKGVMVIPLNVIKKVVTMDINTQTSSANGVGTSGSSEEPAVRVQQTPKTVAEAKKKAGLNKYLDAVILGAILGYGVTYFAEKKGWLPTAVDQKNKLIGASIGALGGAYMVYRFKSSK